MTAIPASFLKVCNFQLSKVSSFRLTLTAAIEVRSRDVKACVNRSVALQHLGDSRRGARQYRTGVGPSSRPIRTRRTSVLS